MEERIISRIDDKIDEIEEALKDLGELAVNDLESYKKDKKTKIASQRYLEIIAEGIISLVFLVIRYKKLISPETEEHAFFILAKNKIISERLATKLKDLKDMRNKLAHQYEKVDDAIVYSAITEEIPKDTEEFLGTIKKV
jgi:uncharacterized protein YutE (UPF0331/DUF86 family)